MASYIVMNIPSSHSISLPFEYTSSHPLSLVPFPYSKVLATLPITTRRHPFLLDMLPPIITSSSNRRRRWWMNKVFLSRTPSLETKKRERLREDEREIEECSMEVMEGLCAYLEKSIPHTFDHDWVVDYSLYYEDEFQFRDPINKLNSLNAYLLNIQLLRWLFTPTCHLHRINQAGPNEIRIRWSMTMDFSFLPWRPQVSFTGTSIMLVNPRTQKIYSHVDYWDSIKNNEYFSYEGLIDIFKQIHFEYAKIDWQTPKYTILKRTISYEVRDYEAFILVERKGDALTSSKMSLKKNFKGEKIAMTTPIFMERLPTPLFGQVELENSCRGVFAVKKCSGIPTRNIGIEKERQLRIALAHDGLKARDGFLVATHTTTHNPWSFVMRNEVLIALEDYKLV